MRALSKIAEDTQVTPPRRGKRRRTTVPLKALGKARANEVDADLAILNRNARRLNREARDVLCFQEPA